MRLELRIVGKGRDKGPVSQSRSKFFRLGQLGVKFLGGCLFSEISVISLALDAKDFAWTCGAEAVDIDTMLLLATSTMP